MIEALWRMVQGFNFEAPLPNFHTHTPTQNSLIFRALNLKLLVAKGVFEVPNFRIGEPGQFERTVN